MTPHCWIDWRHPKKIALFFGTLVAIGIYWSYLVANFKGFGVQGRHVGGPSQFMMFMFIGWVGGWFLGLFVKAEDLN